MLTYPEMCAREGKGSMQRGMHANEDKNYSIVTLTGKYYKDVTVDNDTIIYSGEGQHKHQTYTKNNLLFKDYIDKSKKGKHRRVKVYKRIKQNEWINLGYYELKSTWIDKENGYRVIKFLLTR